jgi:hypothetical protein
VTGTTSGVPPLHSMPRHMQLADTDIVPARRTSEVGSVCEISCEICALDCFLWHLHSFVVRSLPPVSLSHTVCDMPTATYKLLTIVEHAQSLLQPLTACKREGALNNVAQGAMHMSGVPVCFVLSHVPKKQSWQASDCFGEF